MLKYTGKKKLILAALACALVMSLSIGGALAFFSTYSTAAGAVTMDMGFTETIPHEEVDRDGKHVTLENTGDYDCFVRVRAFASIELNYAAPEGDWTDGGDGYWYYGPVLAPGETTKELNISFSYPVTGTEDTPQEFNIVVVQECTPVIYDDNNNPTADWTTVITAE